MSRGSRTEVGKYENTLEHDKHLNKKSIKLGELNKFAFNFGSKYQFFTGKESIWAVNKFRKFDVSQEKLSNCLTGLQISMLCILLLLY